MPWAAHNYKLTLTHQEVPAQGHCVTQRTRDTSCLNDSSGIPPHWWQRTGFFGQIFYKPHEWMVVMGWSLSQSCLLTLINPRKLLPVVFFPSFWVPYLSHPFRTKGSTMAPPWCNLAAILPLSGNNSKDELSVLWPYHSADLLVLMQTTHPSLFTQLFAASCLSHYQHRPFRHP